MSAKGVETTYSERVSRWKLMVIILAVALILTIVLSLNVGFAQIPFPTVLKILAKRIPFLGNLVDSSNVSYVEETIIIQIRMPRILAGALVGVALAAAGVVYQGIFKNPMADPYVLGVSAGAAVGASLAIVLGIGFTLLSLSTVPISAFAGSLLAVFIVYNISRVGSRVPVTTLLLSGLAVSIFLSAIVAVLQVIAGERLHIIVFWLMGGFSYVEWKDVWAVLPLICLGTAVIYFYARDLNILALGEETAQHLGVDIEKVKKLLLVFGSLVTASAVSISGLIAFIGLVIPHITRIMIGPDHRILLPTSMIAGALFLVICDAVARVIVSPVELPVGVITALSGGPFFIYLLRKKKESYAI
ncbi:MAG: iron chelate uptake ABC transporter family permease subunit [Candidatus Bathyarchaeota archaeon]|nr:iron chelate uptake ABC transporter family permease subunit [Candidatus Bathyarchaeota archaeon]MDH5532081.1 iron chelate uptake ABC transporter family permease subunit [Candidatus Bathyarchaeota archaeon]MDH5712678.1 iron chelate uptake ABC transporter family permease subunit [Candidatus Bathyarchaeota archaeon]